MFDPGDSIGRNRYVACRTVTIGGATEISQFHQFLMHKYIISPQ